MTEQENVLLYGSENQLGIYQITARDYKTVPGWDNPYIQNHVVQPLQGALAVQDVELAYELPDAYFHIQTCDDGFDYLVKIQSDADKFSDTVGVTDFKTVWFDTAAD